VCRILPSGSATVRLEGASGRALCQSNAPP
jgi:hypothetical protein